MIPIPEAHALLGAAREMPLISRAAKYPSLFWRVPSNGQSYGPAKIRSTPWETLGKLQSHHVQRKIFIARREGRSGQIAPWAIIS